jgi:hypothetical protein
MMSIAATRCGHTEGRVGLAYVKEGEKVREKIRNI